MLRISLSLFCALALIACDSDPDPIDSGSGRDSGTTPTDAGGGGTDAGGSMDAGGGTDAGGGPSDAGRPTASDASVGDECLFQFQCAADQACTDCTSDLCLCETGARGTGDIGDACSDNSDCANGNCLDVNGTTACTMPCSTAAEASDECGGLFPECGPVPFIGFDNVCRTASAED